MRTGRLLVGLAALASVFLQMPPRTAMGSAVLTVELERAAKPGLEFKECDDCPVMIVVPAGTFTMGSPLSETTEDPEFEGARSWARTPAARGDARKTIRRFQVRSDIRRLGCLRFRGRVPGRPGQLGTRQDACDQRELGRRQEVRGLALAADRQGIPASVGSRMGIRRAGRGRYPLLLGRRSWKGQRELRRLRQPMGPQADRACGIVQAERVWAIRRARQRLGVGRGYLARELRRRSNGRIGVAPGGRSELPHYPRRRLAKRELPRPRGPPREAQHKCSV